MEKKKKSVPGINSSSTADIAFMLLIFFLITTSMDTDRGLARRLPPPPENQEQKQDDIIVKERNVLAVKLNKDDQLMVNGEVGFDIKQLRAKAKEFIVNPNDDPNMPEKHKKNIPMFGEVMITEKHVISVQNDVGTSYNAYIQVQNELVAAYNELRNELANSKFGKDYAECSEDEKKAINEYYPQKISEAEPKKYGGK
mgnify:FL=1